MLARKHSFELSEPEKSLLPTEEHVRQYEELGWHATPKIIPDAALDRAIFGIERYYANERDAVLPLISRHHDWKPDDGDVLRLNGYLGLIIQEIWELVSLPLIAATASRLSRSNTIRLFHDRLIFKPPNIDPSSTLVGWHTDRRYWGTCTSESMITAWIPFEDVTIEMGPVTFINGSHRWENNNGIKAFSNRSLSDLEQEICSYGNEIKKVPMILKRGQISLHHCLTIHGSDANMSDIPRAALSLHLQDSANRYTNFVSENGKSGHHVNDFLCRKTPHNDPDYLDPNIFPILWSDEENASSPE